MPLSDLYLDVWQLIVPHLSTNDLLHIRATNRAMHFIISSDDIWSNIVDKRWFQIEDQSKEAFLNIKRNYLGYYLLRSEKDFLFTQDLVGFKSEKDSRSILSKAYDIVGDDSNQEFISLLLRLKTQNDDLKLKYYSTSILNAIRKKEFLESMDYIFKDDDIEDFMFKMSYLDPAFDRLLPYRKRILDEVIRIVQERLEVDANQAPTSKVNEIVKAFFEVCKCGLNYDYIRGGYDESNSEEHSILRVYAGEVSGTLWIKYAIIQKVATHFKVKSHLAESFLIIQDSGFNDGLALLFLKNDKPQFLSFHYAAQLFPFAAFDSSIKALTRSNIVSIAHSGQLRSLNDRIILPDKDGLKFISNIFPNSKTPLYSEILTSIKFYSWYKSNTKTLSRLKIFEVLNQKYPFELGTYIKINPHLKSFYPIGFLGLPNMDHYTMTKKNEIDSPLPKTDIQTGQIVFNPRTKIFGVIIFPVYEEIDETYPSEFDLSFTVLTINKNNDFWMEPEPVNEITDELIEYVSNFHTIGKYFDRFDPESKLFIFNDVLKKRFEEEVVLNIYIEEI